MYHSSPTSCRQPQHLTVTVSRVANFTCFRFCCASGQVVPCRRRDCNDIALMHERTVSHIIWCSVWRGVDTAQNGHPTIDHARGFRSDDSHGVAQYVASCAMQLEIGREYPQFARFLEPVLCKRTHQGMGGQAPVFEAQNRGRSRPRCSADHTHSKSCVVASTETRTAYQVPTGVVGASPVTGGDDGALWRFLFSFTKSDEEAGSVQRMCGQSGQSDQSFVHSHARGCSVETI